MKTTWILAALAGLLLVTGRLSANIENANTDLDPSTSNTTGRTHRINSSGQAVSQVTPGSDWYVSVRTDGKTRDLNLLIDPSTGWILVGASAVNDSDWIVGYGTNGLGEKQRFPPTPVPTPSSIFSLGFMLALASFRRRH